MPDCEARIQVNIPAPHFLLFSEARRAAGSGEWRFALRMADGSRHFEAADVEPDVQGERLDLLTVVRALESLDQPSRVTLVGCSPYVWRGMCYGLPEWRSNGYRWELFGQMVPVKNGDLWQRLDRALRYHRVECRRRIDAPENRAETTAATLEKTVGSCRKIRFVKPYWLRYRGSPLAGSCRRIIAAARRSWRRGVRACTVLATHGRTLARRCVCELRLR